jgi:citrate lyase beta subunit
MRARRALLYMPGDDMHKIQKAATLGVDCICMDLEDGVALNCKDAARLTIREALQTVDFGASERVVRVNSLQSGMCLADLEALVPLHPDALVLPKVVDAVQVLEACSLISDLETRSCLPERSIGLMVLIETARAVVNLPDICQADERLQALIFGSEDLAGDMGVTRTPAAWEIFYPRSAVVLHAAAFGLQAIDMVCNDFTDLTQLESEARFGAGMGFSGKQVIHPRQVPLVQEAFTPDDASIQAAQKLLQAFQEHQKQGVGAFAVDGKMVDMPVIKTAERLLDRARAAGKI